MCNYLLCSAVTRSTKVTLEYRSRLANTRIMAKVLNQVLIDIYILRVEWVKPLRFCRRFFAGNQFDGFMSEERTTASLARSKEVLPSGLQIDFQSLGTRTLKGIVANRQPQLNKIPFVNPQYFLTITIDNDLVFVVIATEDRIAPEAGCWSINCYGNEFRSLCRNLRRNNRKSDYCNPHGFRRSYCWESFLIHLNPPISIRTRADGMPFGR